MDGAIQPPNSQLGHHAEFTKAMGFCLFNNVVIAAKVAQKKFGVKRILIIDWDGL
jgi:acetoin utilization deacetylase AcuC-like enzyme